MIAFSVPEIFAGVVAIVGLLLTVMNIVDKAATIREKAAEPEAKQNERIASLETKVKELEGRLDKNNDRLHSQETCNKIILQSLSALLAHGIDGNNTQKLQKAEDDLNAYLIEREG